MSKYQTNNTSFLQPRQLSSQDRIQLHRHLFTSLLIYSLISAFLKAYLLYTQSSSTPSMLEINSIGLRQMLCLLPSILLRYFRSTNYLWMFNEAVYLHRLIKKAFHAPSLRPLIVVAYGLPLVTTTVYIISRYLSDVNVTPITVPVNSVEHVLETILNTNTTTNNQFDTSRGNSIVRRSINANKIILKAIELTLIEDLRMFFVDKYNLNHHQQQQLAPWMQHLVEIVNEDNFKNDPRPTAEALAIVTSQCLGDHLRSQKQHQCDNILATSETLAESNNVHSGDNCWLMPSDIGWHEWIINVPNCAILIVCNIRIIISTIINISKL